MALNANHALFKINHTTLIVSLLLNFSDLVSASLDVNLKTALGVKKLSTGVYRQKSVFNSLFHQGNLEFNYDDALGFSVAAKGV